MGEGIFEEEFYRYVVGLLQFPLSYKQHSELAKDLSEKEEFREKYTSTAKEGKQKFDAYVKGKLEEITKNTAISDFVDIALGSDWTKPDQFKEVVDSLQINILAHFK